MKHTKEINATTEKTEIADASDNSFWKAEDLIYSYTRQQALEDGVLIDVTDMAEKVGFRCPVAFTSAAWGEYIAVTDSRRHPDEAGRLQDLLTLIRMAYSAADLFPVFGISLSVKVRNRECRISLKAVVGPGDNYEPVMTVMLPDED